MCGCSSSFDGETNNLNSFDRDEDFDNFGGRVR